MGAGEVSNGLGDDWKHLVAMELARTLRLRESGMVQTDADM